MFNVLLESRATRPRRSGGTVASALMHGALVAAGMWLATPESGRAVGSRKPETREIHLVPVRPLPRERHRSGRSSPNGGAGQRALTNPTFTGTTLPPLDFVPVQLSSDAVSAPSDSFSQIDRTPGRDPGQPGGVYSELLVDRIPRVIGRAPEPRYPASLREAGIQGRVVAEFVVDTLGRVELEGLTVDAPQALFAESVRAVLPRYRFTPGEAAGRKVRTRVQLPFDFALVR